MAKKTVYSKAEIIVMVEDDILAVVNGHDKKARWADKKRDRKAKVAYLEAILFYLKVDKN